MGCRFYPNEVVFIQEGEIELWNSQVYVNRTRVSSLPKPFHPRCILSEYSRTSLSQQHELCDDIASPLVVNAIKTQQRRPSFSMPPSPSPLSQLDIISRRSELVEVKKSDYLKPLRCREDKTNDEVVMTVYCSCEIFVTC